MAVNLLEEYRLVYHDEDATTLEIRSPQDKRTTHLQLYAIDNFRESDSVINMVVDRDAVETLRDSLTCWLETGKLR